MSFPFFPSVVLVDYNLAQAAFFMCTRLLSQCVSVALGAARAEKAFVVEEVEGLSQLLSPKLPFGLKAFLRFCLFFSLSFSPLLMENGKRERDTEKRKKRRKQSRLL